MQFKILEKTLVLVIVISSILDANNTWVCNGPYDARVRTIAIHPINRRLLFIGTIEGSIYRSLNGGESWSPLNFPTPEPSARLIKFHPLAPDTVFYSTTEGIFRSDDCGNSWTRLDLGRYTINEYRNLAIHPTNPNIMLAGNWGYIIKTEDGGHSWRIINIPVYMSDIEFDPLDSNLVYGSAYSGQTGKSVFKSTDLGENWINISNDLDSAAGAENIEIDHFYPNTIYLARTGYYGPGHSAAKSTDGGRHWLNITPPQMQREVAFCIIASKITPNTVYLTTLGDGVFRSRDGGLNWTPIDTGLNVSMTSQILEDSATRILYLGTFYDGIYKSNDDGAHWIKISQNIKNAECIELVANTRDSDSLYVVTGSGLFRSIDKAQSWQRINLTPPCFYGLTGCIAMDKYNPQNIYVGYSTYNGQGIGGIIRSSDGGLSWNYQTNGLPENCMPQKIRLAYSGNLLYRIYLADQYDLYFSEDNGENWIVIGGDLPTNTSFSQLTVNENDPNLIYAGCDLLGTYFRSTDGGISWDLLSNMPLGDSPQEIVCDPIDPYLIYANCGVGQGLFSSPDRGQTWYENNGNLPRYNNYFAISGLTINPLNSLNILINSYNYGFFISQDGGNQWDSLNIGLRTAHLIGDILLDPIDTNRIFLATLESSVWSIQRTSGDINHQTVPCEFSLHPNYPNPFNSSTTIRYTIPTAGPVTLDIYDILGRKVQTLLDISQQAGEYRTVWEADKFASGFYFARLTSGSQSKNIKLTLLK